MRKVTYVQAINEALHQIIAADKRVFLIGQGVTSPWYVGATTVGLYDKFGPERIIDTPVSENGVTGAAVGAAIAGMRPIVVHPRMDFMYYAMDSLANQAANWHYMFAGKVNVPLVVWTIINRGGEQGAQHSQALQAIYTHIPGLKVVMPSTAYDVKGLLYASVLDNNPVIFIDERWLYSETSDVPEDLYTVPLGTGIIRRAGNDVTVLATSFMVSEALKAALDLEKDGISIEVIDPRSLKPFDEKLLLESLRKTGRLVVADAAWKTCGFGAEVAALAAEKAFAYLKAPIERVTLPDTPAPAASSLENVYYPRAKDIIAAVKKAAAYRPVRE
jgi:acetoin:2,6-dichlorophenolindophenol oxidoreductase subunit beta